MLPNHNTLKYDKPVLISPKKVYVLMRPCRAAWVHNLGGLTKWPTDCFVAQTHWAQFLAEIPYSLHQQLVFGTRFSWKAGDNKSPSSTIQVLTTTLSGKRCSKTLTHKVVEFHHKPSKQKPTRTNWIIFNHFQNRKMNVKATIDKTMNQIYCEKPIQ